MNPGAQSQSKAADIAVILQQRGSQSEKQTSTPEDSYSPHESSGGTPYHYIILRADLTKGQQLAQCTHAAGESVRGSVPPGTHAVVLSVPNEEWLLAIASRLQHASIPHKLIIEPDMTASEGSSLNGQATAIGLCPSYDRAKIASVLGRLPLLR